MRLDLFADSSAGQLVPIAGVDPVRGEWTHAAFVPHPLPAVSPELSGATYRAVADARASLGVAVAELLQGDVLGSGDVALGVVAR